MESTNVVARFHDDGFIVAPRLLGPEFVEQMVVQLEQRSGRRRTDDWSAARSAGALRGWTVPDGVTRFPEFWPLIFHEPLLHLVRSLLGNEIRFLQHTDLHVGFSSFSWHRDSVNRNYGAGPDWNERSQPYRIVRVGVYLHMQEGGGFKLGLVPGTHRPPRASEAADHRRAERASGSWGHVVRAVTGRNLNPPRAQWVSAAAGDAVIFDPRVLHTGTPVDGPKYSVFVAFGIPNSHFARHRHYYRHVRADLGYLDPVPALIEQLKTHELYAAPATPGETDELASVPSGMLSRLGKRFRFHV